VSAILKKSKSVPFARGDGKGYRVPAARRLWAAVKSAKK